MNYLFLFSFITRGLNRKFASRPPVREVFKIFIEFLISDFIVSWLCLGIGFCRDAVPVPGSPAVSSNQELEKF